jgi:hypothetical protein
MILFWLPPYLETEMSGWALAAGALAAMLYWWWRWRR